MQHEIMLLTAALRVVASGRHGPVSTGLFPASYHDWQRPTVHATLLCQPTVPMILHNAGDGLVVSSSGPGIFLQGLAVHGPSGVPLPGAALDRAVVRAAFEYADQNGVPLCAFLGDSCATLRMAPELEVGARDAILTFCDPTCIYDRPCASQWHDLKADSNLLLGD